MLAVLQFSSSTMEEKIKLVVKWSGKEYKIEEFPVNETVLELKEAIHKLTSVLPARQKLLNVKNKGKLADDLCKISALGLKPGYKIMMMGSLEEDIAAVDIAQEDVPNVINDLDVEEEQVAIENYDIYLRKIQKRVDTYEIVERSPPREGKKLLVLDIDYTLFDHRSAAETGAELMRPYLHEFLQSAYDDYDIVIWSATSMKWIEEKMNLLGVSTHSAYKILFYIDGLAMISVYTDRTGVTDVKPLGVIWGKYPQYSAKNTIMIDDIRRNFFMNPKNGLRIRAFRQAHLNRDKDKELLKLSTYLKKISLHDDLSKINHRHWERFGL